MSNNGWAADLGRGLIVGLCATEALDAISTLIYEAEDDNERWAEDAARGHLHAYERATEKLWLSRGIQLSRSEAQRWGWRFHKAFGLLGGVGYWYLRRRWSALGAGWGTAFGSAFFLLGDEVLVPLAGLTPGPRAFSWKVHARGAISHIAYGVAAEAAARLLERRRR